MKINQHVSVSLSFTCEDKQLIKRLLLDRVGSKTIKKALDWPYWWLPLFGAWAKISGYSGNICQGSVTFNSSEKNAICDVLRDAYNDAETYDQETRDQILPILEAIFDNF